MLLLVGLGNPGPEHAGNRHNIGFMAMDEIVRRYSFTPYRRRFRGEVAEGTVDGVKVLALKPMTYMNRSGQSIGEAVRFYKLQTDQVTVIYDEIDLAPGKIRVRTGGGHGGHNGMRDIIAHVGPEFRRVRLGVGHPGSKDKVNPHVLRDFSKAERPFFDKLIDAVAAEIPLLVTGDDNAFMSRVSHLIAPPKPKPQPKPDPEKAKADEDRSDGDPEPDGDADGV